MERIAIIGFGSLIWDLDDLEPHVTGEWFVAQGPTLPIEFALVSRKRNRALAAVIDHSLGEHVTCSVIESSKTSLHDALEDLARRERCEPQHIGATHRANGFSRAKHAQTLRLVELWLHATHYDGAVWTDTQTNFETTTGEPFTLETAIEYLRELEGDSLRQAKQYIEKAPVSTPLRRRLLDEHWWVDVEF